ncbi:MAG: phosphatidate cytidylyltransferase [Oceanicaulis sp.]
METAGAGLSAVFPSPALALGYSGVVALLLLGTLAAALLPRLDPARFADLPARVRTWWILFAVAGGALLAGWAVFTLVLAAISYIAVREFVSLAPTRKEDRGAVLFVYASVAISYGAVFADSYAAFLVIAPIYIFVGAAVLLSLAGRPEGFLTTAGVLQFGVIVCVYFTGHLALLMRVPAEELGPSGPAGLVFLVLLATQAGGVADYVVQTLAAPDAAPGTSLRGRLAHGVVSAGAFIALAPVFSPLQTWQAVVVGIGLPVWALCGDQVVRAMRRELGVQSTSLLLPGHGGALDRLAGLAFAAPWCFHMIAFFALERY